MNRCCPCEPPSPARRLSAELRKTPGSSRRTANTMLRIFVKSTPFTPGRARAVRQIAVSNFSSTLHCEVFSVATRRQPIAWDARSRKETPPAPQSREATTGERSIHPEPMHLMRKCDHSPRSNAARALASSLRSNNHRHESPKLSNMPPVQLRLELSIFTW